MPRLDLYRPEQLFNSSILSQQGLRFFMDLQRFLGRFGGIDWSLVDTVGSDISTLGGVLPHSALSGLSADGHVQYLLLAGREGQTVVTPLILGTATDNTTVEADGTLVANGGARCWRDIDVDLNPQTSGGSVPAITAINGDPYLTARGFAGTGATVEQLGGSKEVPHDHAEDTDIIPHIHWAPTTADAGDVKWQLRYMWINRNGIYENGATISVVTPTPGVAWNGLRSDFPAISGVGKASGSRLVFTLFRDPADVEDTYAHTVIAPNFGVHYQVDMLGTREVGTK